jgi:hypothetical protein
MYGLAHADATAAAAIIIMRLELMMKAPSSAGHVFKTG